MSNGLSSYYSVSWTITHKLSDRIWRVVRTKDKQIGYLTHNTSDWRVVVLLPSHAWEVIEAGLPNQNTVKTTKTGAIGNYAESHPDYQDIVTALMHEAISEE